MKPRPTTIQPGATHWNPNAGPDWYAKDFGRWMYYRGLNGKWENSNSEIILVDFSALIPVEELMAQPPEWNGEGLPPVGTVCEVSIGAIAGGSQWVACTILAHDIGPDEIAVYRRKDGVYRGSTWDFFRPIKTEREKAIEAISLEISRSYCLTKDLTNAIAAALYNEGYRKVEK
jgi:hypothetical protein